jgi:8-oxo-dGTP pyrophosphatase MutT (NUDIX family)
MSERRQAAVVIAIFRLPPHGIVFVERAEHLRDHPGQIGLPGGGVHAEDRDLQATALRELHEEVGIEPGRAKIVAELPMFRQSRANNFDVTPFVAVVEEGELRIDASETAGVFVVPLATVLDRGLREGRVEHAGVHVQSLVLEHDGRRIWGLTAHILHDFVTAWNDRDLQARVVPHLLRDSLNGTAPDRP